MVIKVPNTELDSQKKIPKHIGIIMDGNRRYAKKLGLISWMGHEYGAKTMLNTIKWAKKLGINQLTFYAFSTENFKRSKDEFDKMMELFARIAVELLEKIHNAKERACIRFVGLLHLFPKKIQDLMNKVMDATRTFTDFVVNIAVGYGARSELIKAFKTLAHKIKAGQLDIEMVDENMVSNELFIADEPEIIIRTGGTKRLSNFLLWQASYSEIYFMDKLWPEFTKQDLINCIDDYSKNVNVNLGR
jgi:tritrans,polycis-undecaprenyl-diphosphate synthase [geranylgeranyl-diphosphate specific]